MKNKPIQSFILTAATVALLGLAGSGTASADPDLGIRIGVQGPPPPRHDYRQWQRPDEYAVWVPGHHEWQDGQYVWIGGYYAHPRHRHSRWIAPRYSHTHDGYFYNAGHWSD